jgi:hypothetical protein
MKQSVAGEAGLVVVGLFLVLTVLVGLERAGASAPHEPTVRAAGQFVVECLYTGSLRDDPLVFPDEPGASHRHDFFGAEGVDAFTDLGALVERETSCRQPADKAAYWAPSLLLDHEPVEPYSSDAYYLIAPGSDGSSIQPMPEGFAMITDRVEWACGRSRLTSDRPPDCPPLAPLAARHTFPSCWDGRSLDSEDHRSHVTEAVRGRCPSSHPVEIPEVTFVIHYTVNGDVVDRLSLASGGLATAHADFVNGWEPGRLAREISACLHRNLVCNVPDDF